MSSVLPEFDSKFRTQAQKIDADFRRQADGVRRDTSLSDTGKAQKIAQLETARVASVKALQNDAASWVRVKGQLQRLALQDARRDATQERRELLGDVVFADIVRRNLEAMTPAQIVQWYGECESDTWLRAAIEEYGSLTLRARGDTPDVYSALSTLDAGDPTEELARDVQALVQRGDAMVAELDIAFAARDMADRLGVSPDAVRAQYAPDAVPA